MQRQEPFSGTITAVVAQPVVRKHLGARVNVFIDEKFSFAVSYDVALKHGLRSGLTIDAELLKTILHEDGEAKAMNTAVNFLGYRQRSSEEIRIRLRKDDWSETVIDRVIERLRAVQLLDDAQFANAWVQHRTTSKPRGSRLIKQELRFKGVAKEEIEAALPDENDELQNAVVAIQKLERKLEKFEGREQEQKAIEFLARRGFSFGTAKSAFKLWQENAENT
jgi:regulatory protein